MANLLRIEQTNTCLKFMQAAQWYEWNVSRRGIIEVAYGPDHAEGYLKEKVGKLAKYGLLGLFAEMDSAARRRLVKAIIDTYGHDAGLLPYVCEVAPDQGGAIITARCEHTDFSNCMDPECSSHGKDALPDRDVWGVS